MIGYAIGDQPVVTIGVSKSFPLTGHAKFVCQYTEQSPVNKGRSTHKAAKLRFTGTLATNFATWSISHTPHVLGRRSPM